MKNQSTAIFCLVICLMATLTLSAYSTNKFRSHNHKTLDELRQERNTQNFDASSYRNLIVEEIRRDIENEFENHDEDENGKINKKELSDDYIDEFNSDFHTNFTKEEFFARCDVGSDGLDEGEAFKCAFNRMMELRKGTMEAVRERIEKIFKEHDSDNNDLLTRKEFQPVGEMMRKKLNITASVDDIFKHLDQDDSKLTQREFIQAALDYVWEQEIKEKVVMLAEKAFMDSDVDGDGRLTFEEMKPVLIYVKSEHNMPFSLKEMFDHADQDDNGSVTKDEMIEGAMELLGFIKDRANKKAEESRGEHDQESP